jgi:chaperonin cofactor prefoldin
MTASLDDLAARIAALEEREQRLEEQVQELQQDARVKAVGWMVGRVYEDTQALRVKLDEHDRRFDQVDARFDRLEDRVETGFATLGNAMDEILRELRNRPT